MPPADDSVTTPATGDLAATSPEALLRFCERVRFTGTLEFQGDQHRGVLPMLNGVPEMPPGDTLIETAVDDLLTMTHGEYTLKQLLPPLEGAATEGELGLTGSLAQSTVADLLRYCEAAGLSGTLKLFRDDRACVARYNFGELVSLTVDEEASADLTDLFAWNRGDFAISARSVFETPRATTDEPDVRLLKTVEFELAQILQKSERGAELALPAKAPVPRPSMLRGITRPFGLKNAPAGVVADASPPSAQGERNDASATSATSATPPTSAPVPAPVRVQTAKHHVRSVPPPPSPESTVKVYFVDRGPPERNSSTQHAAAGLGAETISLDPSDSHKLPAVRDTDADALLARTPVQPAAERVPEPAVAASNDAPSASSRPAPAAPIAVRTPGPEAPPRTHVPLTAMFAAVLALTAVAAVYTLLGLVR